MTDFAPPTPQPAATRDGVGLDPLAGGFLPPYAERLDLIRPFPALSAEAMGAALLDDGADAGGTRDDGAEPGGRAAGAPFGGDALAAMDAFNAPFGEAERTRATAEDREIDGPHGPVPVRVYRPEPGWRPPAPSPAGPSSDTRALKGVTGALAMLTPLIPIVLVAALKLPVTVAFTIGIAWCLVFTARGFSRAMNTLAKTCYDGITDAGPAVILMVGIGILFLSVTHPKVKEVLDPILLAVVPSSRWAYILFFIFKPLALYRGPMNMFGLGSGIAALITGLGTMNPLAVMAAFLSAERIQAGADPTNTQNVWTANFCEVDVNTCTKRILPYLWAVSAIGVLLGAFLYF